MICANCGAIAVIANTTYMTIMELFDEWPTPSSHEMMIIVDYENNIYIELEVSREHIPRMEHLWL